MKIYENLLFNKLMSYTMMFCAMIAAIHLKCKHSNNNAQVRKLILCLDIGSRSNKTSKQILTRKEFLRKEMI